MLAGGANNLAGGRVLITRPMLDGAATAQKLQAMGYQPQLLPLSVTVPTEAELPADKFEAVVVTSANALRHIQPQQLAPLRHLKLYAVGEKTANVARESKFNDIYAGDGWGLNLGKYVAKQHEAGAVLLYLTGKIRRPDFEAQMAQAGILLKVTETYDTVPLLYDEPALMPVFSAGLPQIVLLYSAVAAQQLVALDRQMQGMLLRSADLFLCLSRRIAAELPPECAERVRISETPDEPSLLHLLG